VVHGLPWGTCLIACLLKNEPASSGVWWQGDGPWRAAAPAKASPKRAFDRSGQPLRSASHAGDPKPGELPLASVKVR
jgi:hypothetical protein